jgi:hypothetical protein
MLPRNILLSLVLISVRRVVGECVSDGDSNIETAVVDLQYAYDDLGSADYPLAVVQAGEAQSLLGCVIGLQSSSLEESQLISASDYLGEAIQQMYANEWGTAGEYLNYACTELYPFCPT